MVWGLMINYMKLPIEERLEALAKISDHRLACTPFR